MGQGDSPWERPGGDRVLMSGRPRGESAREESTTPRIDTQEGEKGKSRTLFEIRNGDDS